MPIESLVPALDPNPLPAPAWVLQVLLLATLTLHLLAMNLALGSALMAGWLRLGTRHPERPRLAGELARKIPVFLPAAITLGVAPLLFLQVLYGPFFYSATVILGWPWLSVLGLLTAAYYAAYFASFRARVATGAPAWSVWAPALLLTGIAFLYVNALTLATTPDRWAATYLADPSGWNLNLGEATLAPRLLHFLVASVAVAGLLACWLGRIRRLQEPAYGSWLLKFGARTFTWATAAQFAVGIWFLAALPVPVRAALVGGDPLATSLLVLAVLGAGAAMAATLGMACRGTPRGLWLAGSLTTGTVLLMVLVRDAVRRVYLAPHLNQAGPTVQTQWEVFPLFLLVFLLGAALWVAMLRRYPFSPAGAPKTP